MKVKCTNCGKKFHYEKMERVCKYCGRYMRNPAESEGNESAIFFKDTGNDTYSNGSYKNESYQNESYNQEHYQYKTLENISEEKKRKNDNASKQQVQKEKTQKEKPNKDKKNYWTTTQKISCTVIAITMVILFLIVRYDTVKQVSVSKAIKNVGEVKKTAADMEQDIQIADGILCITNYGGVKAWQEQIPEGFKLFYVEFQVKQDMEEYFRYHLDTYLKLSDETYIEPLRQMRLAEELGSDWQTLEENYGIYDTIDSENGKLLFLVPENMESAEFLIYYSSEEKLAAGDEIDKLECIYSIPVRLEAKLHVGSKTYF